MMFNISFRIALAIFLVCFGSNATNAQKRDAGRSSHNKKHYSERSHDAQKQEIVTTRPQTRVLPPPNDESVFHFVIYGDRTGGVPEGLKVLEQAVSDTNLLDPDFVMTVGDLIQGYNETPKWIKQMEEYKSIMDRLRMKWFPVAGNHDIYWSGDGKAPAGHHESNFEEHFGPLWYFFRHKNSGIITLYSDEGDPDTNRKGFHKGSLQKMSDEQLLFLDKALSELRDADHIFVFLHHPRWIGNGYSGGNWDVVHKKLREAGNVSAVFAGHIHRMRYDPKDGIEYFTLATTGGGLSAEIPGAGYLHQLNMVTVRKDRIAVSSIPVGAVFDPKDFTKELLADIDLARSIRPIQEASEILLEHDGMANGEVKFKITNPSSQTVSATVSFEPLAKDSRWSSTLGHAHFDLAANETTEKVLQLKRESGEAKDAAVPAVRLQLDYLGESSRIQLPEVITPIRIKPGRVSPDYFDQKESLGLVVSDNQSAIRVAPEQLDLPDGPMTLELWVRTADLTGYNAIIAKGLEYSMYSVKGVPQFDIHLGGQYVTVKAPEALQKNRWTHLAGVFDGERVMLFVDGKRVASQTGNGSRRISKLPLYVGADSYHDGRPFRSFQVMIDEVRIAKTAVYSEGFTPKKRLSPTDNTLLLLHLDRNFGPFVLDHSSSAAYGILGTTSKLIPVSDN